MKRWISRQELMIWTWDQDAPILPLTQYGHSKWALFVWPQAEHLFNARTSFIPFPAICRDLFFMCEVFFFGTARNIPSHNPSNISGMLSCMAAGIAKVILGRTGRDSCREYRVVNLEVLEAFCVDNRGRNEESIDLVVACMADILEADLMASEFLGGINCVCWYFVSWSTRLSNLKQFGSSISWLQELFPIRS